MADITYPIIFSAPMVRALLDGRKTQTRRLAWEDKRVSAQALAMMEKTGVAHQQPSIWHKRHDKFQAGERPWLWVKETLTRSGGYAQYVANHKSSRHLWESFWKQDPRPSIHMNQYLSRLSLRVTDMRIERLQDISEEDAKAEGIYQTDREGWLPPHPKMWTYEGNIFFDRSAAAFNHLWRAINGDGSWAANPEVVVTEFETHQQNIEAIHG